MLNVTEQKRIEEDLAARKEQMELFFEAARFGAWDCDLTKGTIAYNDSLLNMLGYQPGELTGTREEWYSLIYPDDLAPFKSAMRAVLTGEAPSLDIEVRIKCKDGQYLWTYDVARIMGRDDRGRPLRMVGGNFDFSQRKKMEEEFFQITKKERKARLARELAEESARAKSEFLANMSHEIRTPMNAIQGLTHLVMQTELNEQQYEYLQRISTATKALLRIINDILDFSKIEAGKLEIEKADFNLQTLVKSSISLHIPQAETKGVHLNYVFPHDVPVYVIGDQVRVGQIINNLLSNAIKFTPKGLVTLKVELQQIEFDNALIQFSVIDTGIGLSEEQRSQLFTAFTQADTSITRRYGGTGLGLTISKRLSEMMGGTIWCESELGKGSNFSFTVKLGVSADQKQQEDDGEQDPSQSFKGIKAIVIDDNPTALEIINQALVQKNIEVNAFSNGPEAIEYLKRNPASQDLILVDWKMPVMDGLEAIKAIKEGMVLKTTSVIVMVTAYDRDEVIGSARELGVSKVLTKPVTASHLYNLLVELFGHKIPPAKPKRKTQVVDKDLVKEIQGAKLLLVEDNEVNQLVASKILGNAGFEVAIASDGQKAVDMVKENSYDLILMDVQMPIMDGLTATKVIRSLGYDDVPIVAMTAHAMSDDRLLSLQAGMNDHINKPINVNELFQTLLKWITARKDEKN
jgi:PAS domain S-box-containing protein